MVVRIMKCMALHRLDSAHPAPYESVGLRIQVIPAIQSKEAQGQKSLIVLLLNIFEVYLPYLKKTTFVSCNIKFTNIPSTDYILLALNRSIRNILVALCLWISGKV